METRNLSNKYMRKDSEWSVIDGEPCRVIDFVPLGSLVKDGKVIAADMTTPYASVTIECKKISQEITGFITHKMDFAHLWAAFKERDISDNEEVIIIWTTKHYKYKFLKFLPPVYPKMWVMICPKGALEIMVDSNWKPELTGETRWNAMKPIVEWKLEIMKLRRGLLWNIGLKPGNTNKENITCGRSNLT